MTTLGKCVIAACIAAGNAVLLGAQGHPAATAHASDCAKLTAASVDHANMDHAAHQSMISDCANLDTSVPTNSGQAAFAAMSEVVRMLEADPHTDWSKVNIEALRQHLIDMDYVTMRSEVVQRPVIGGLQMDVTGSGRTLLAIRRMAASHTAMLDQSTEYRASATEIRGGARITITAKDTSDASLVARIRGLGFAGLLTEGDHHARHHLALARGDASPHTR
jgi:hypothetical protein